MTRRVSSLDAAHRRIRILQALVEAERRRAEANPYHERNGDLGIVPPDTPRDRVPAQIKATFDDLEAFLNHLGVAHLATAFEQAARDRLKTAIGEARRVVAVSRKGGTRWLADLVRSPESFDGLAAVGSVLPFEHGEEDAYKLIRESRNGFSHSVPTAGAPAIAGDEALIVLAALLDRIRV